MQPAGTTFRVPAIDAPNLRGARDLGLLDDHSAPGTPDHGRLGADVDAGRVRALIVLDPGPPGSLGNLGWIIDRRHQGVLGTLVVVGALRSPLVEAADVVLPGATSLEKDACYVNDQGRVQPASRAVEPPGEAREDWQVLTDLARACHVPLDFGCAREVRAAVAVALQHLPGYASLAEVEFRRPRLALHWLQASNPSERLKWHRLFRDAPPVKFADQSATPAGEAESKPARDTR